MSQTKQVRVNRYVRPEFDRGQRVVVLARSESMSFLVHTIKEGGEENLHSHPGSDAYWFVLSGRIRFYGEGDEVLAELGQEEGIFIPRGFKYWFALVGSEPVEVIRAASNTPQVKRGRVDHAPMTESTKEAFATAVQL